MAYDFANYEGDITDIKRYRVTNFIMYPTQWQQYPSRVSLTWNEVKFSENSIDDVPDDEIGVYSFIVKTEIANHPYFAYPLYIGMTEKQSFRDRYKQYLGEVVAKKPRPKIKLMLTNWAENLYFVYAPIQNAHIIEDVEDDLLSAIIPPCNTKFPATIRPLIAAALM